MKQFSAIFYKEAVSFSQNWLSTSLGYAVGPLLYLIAFGWGLSASNPEYASFVVPGIIAMNSMSVPFGYIANDVNLARIYAKTFEAVMVAPVSMAGWAFTRILAASLRGMYSISLIWLTALLFGKAPALSVYFIGAVFLNALVFSSFGLIAGLIVDSHASMARITNFIITPMAFLCGTFFPLSRFPEPAAGIIRLLPLSQTVSALRDGFDGAGLTPILMLIAFFAIFGPLSVFIAAKTE